MTTLLLTTVVVVSFAGLWTGVVAVSDYLVSVVAKWLKNYTAALGLPLATEGTQEPTPCVKLHSRTDPVCKMKQ